MAFRRLVPVTRARGLAPGAVGVGVGAAGRPAGAAGSGIRLRSRPTGRRPVPAADDGGTDSHGQGQGVKWHAPLDARHLLAVVLPVPAAPLGRLWHSGCRTHTRWESPHGPTSALVRTQAAGISSQRPSTYHRRQKVAHLLVWRQVLGKPRRTQPARTQYTNASMSSEEFAWLDSHRAAAAAPPPTRHRSGPSDTSAAQPSLPPPPAPAMPIGFPTGGLRPPGHRGIRTAVGHVGNGRGSVLGWGVW